MVFSRLGWFACLAMAPAYAGIIDVSSQSSVMLQNGESLTFAISAWGYQADAPEFAVSADPAYVSFSLLTNTLINASDLDFSLEAYGGASNAAVDDTSVSPGYFAGSLYQGPVSVESGSLALSPQLSSQLFGGPALLLGSGRRRRRFVGLLTLLAIAISRSEPIGRRVQRGRRGGRGHLGPGFGFPGSAMGIERPFAAHVPEPHSGALLALGAIFLCVLVECASRPPFFRRPPR